MKARILIVSAALCVAAVASASLTQVYSYAALGANDTIDHGQLGTAGTLVSSGAIEVSTFGLHARVSLTDGAPMYRVDEGNGWYGHFPSGDHLLWSDLDPGPMNYLLDSTVSSIGMAIQADNGLGYTASMTVYDGLGRNLGTFTTATFQGGTGGGGPAAFVGVVSSRANIGSVSVSVVSSSGLGNDFAIDHVDLHNCSPTPEPAALLALGLGIGGLLLRRKSA